MHLSLLWSLLYRFLVSALSAADRRKKIGAPRKIIFTAHVFTPVCRAEGADQKLM
jgi:hypothetical protein